MDVRAFRAKIEVLSPTSACTSIVANVDPKAPVPRSVVNFVVSWCMHSCCFPCHFGRACGGSPGPFTEMLTAVNDATLTQVRKAAGMFLYCLKQAARRITADEGNCHFQRIAEDEEFYKEWLFPRFERFYKRRGWAFDGGITIGGTSSGRSAESAARIDGPPGGTKGASHRFCLPFRLKSGQRSREPPGFLKPRRQPRKPKVDVPQPQVGPTPW